MSEIPTPITDAAAFRYDESGVEIVPVNVSRSLERTLGVVLAENERLTRERDEANRLHSELLYQVGIKHPGESRHETALRYLKQAERSNNDPAQAKRATDSGHE